MFLSALEPITNQTVAVAVLVMILGGLGWLVRQLFSLLPSLLDRFDKQEEKRSQTIEKMIIRLENAIDKMSHNYVSCMASIKESIDDSNRLKTLILAKLNSPCSYSSISTPGSPSNTPAEHNAQVK